ncbi:MAG TPA: CGNR zinc finger domain-containing protein [Actinomycetota bacterium]|nr:CGNR zinc finger domain-containing protein [Actinomycetota bacterium]
MSFDDEARPAQAGRRPPVPDPLRLVADLVNTRDVEADEDELPTPEALAAWSAGRGLLEPGTRISRGAFEQVLEVREALRALALANTDEPIQSGAVDILNRASEEAPLVVRFGPDGSARLEPDSPEVDGLTGTILAVVHGAMADGTWVRLKACRKHSCRWVFYDHSKNRSGTWCSMAVCGNRVKTRTYRERRSTAVRRVPQGRDGSPRAS